MCRVVAWWRIDMAAFTGHRKHPLKRLNFQMAKLVGLLSKRKRMCTWIGDIPGAGWSTEKWSSLVPFASKKLKSDVWNAIGVPLNIPASGLSGSLAKLDGWFPERVLCPYSPSLLPVWIPRHIQSSKAADLSRKLVWSCQQACCALWWIQCRIVDVSGSFFERDSCQAAHLAKTSAKIGCRALCSLGGWSDESHLLGRWMQL